VRITLELMSGAQDGEVMKISRTSTIGREKSNEIPLQYDRYISRRHARIIVNDPLVYLEDLSSTNGTYYDGERLTGRVQLENGEHCRIGRTWMQINW